MKKRPAKGHPKALISGKRCFLRSPEMKDCEEFIAAVKASRKLHDRWTRQPSTKEKFRAYVRQNSGDRVRVFVCRKEGSAIVGNIHFNNIIRGNFHSCFLSYAAIATYAGKGYMTEGLKLAMRYGFTKLKLHRLEANIQPANVRSIALVKRCGFIKEGLSPRYLKIAGRWRDHERWAITKEAWRR